MRVCPFGLTRVCLGGGFLATRLVDLLEVAGLGAAGRGSWRPHRKSGRARGRSECADVAHDEVVELAGDTRGLASSSSVASCLLMVERPRPVVSASSAAVDSDFWVSASEALGGVGLVGVGLVGGLAGHDGGPFRSPQRTSMRTRRHRTRHLSRSRVVVTKARRASAAYGVIAPRGDEQHFNRRSAILERSGKDSGRGCRAASDDGGNQVRA